MSSSRQLLADGHGKRADLVKIQLEHIHVEPNFNAPESPDEFTARVQAMALHLAEGGRLPPIEVRDRAEGGVFIVDGHARVAAHALAEKNGVPLADPKDGKVYLLTIPFTGNDADRTLRIVTSAEGRTLSALQLSVLYKRLQAFGWTASEIARKVGKTPQHVGQVLTLGNANSDVQKAVQAGEVSATEAVRAVKKHKDKAGAVLQEQLQQAKAEGKKKVTSAVVNAEKKATKAREHADLLADAEMFRWLVAKGAVQWSLMQDSVEMTFPLEADNFDDLRHAVKQAMAAPEVQP